MLDKTPKVSIGLAVYNGEDFLEEAIDSILGQTFTDFELIISDNASTDRTAEICQAYLLKDKRIRYHRNSKNIGGANNENLTFEMARGKYFRWAAHDDVCAPTLVEKSVAIMDAHPDVVLCYPIIIKIDAEGNEFETLDDGRGTSNQPFVRFRDLSRPETGCEPIYGLIRPEALRRTGLQRNYTDSDRTLLSHLALLGRFYMLPEALFYKRIHAKKSTEVFADWRQRMEWFDPDNKDRITFPHWLQFFHYLEVIQDAPLALGQRLRCYLHIGQWVLKNKRWGKLANDVVIAIRKKFRQVSRSVAYGR